METTQNDENSLQSTTSLDEISAQASVDVDLQAANTETNNSAKPAVTVDFVAESRLTCGFVFDTLIGLFPRLIEIYPPEKQEQIAVNWAPVAEYNGWTIGGFTGSPWFGFAFVVIPTLPGAYKIVTDKNQPVENKTEAGYMRPILDTTDATSLHNKA